MTKGITLATILLLFIMSVFTGCAGTSADSFKTEKVNLKDLYTPDADELEQMIDGLDNLSVTDDTTVIIPNAAHMYEYSAMSADVFHKAPPININFADIFGFRPNYCRNNSGRQ